MTVPIERRYVAAGVTAHRTRSLPSVDIARVDGIPVTTVTRTLIDVASAGSFGVLQEAIDDAVRRGDTRPQRIRWRLAELGGPGRRGTRALARILAEYEPGAKVPASVFERRLLRVVDMSDLPRPTIRPAIQVGPNLVLEADAGWLEFCVLVEANSSRHHDSQQAIERDERRRALLAAAGYRIVPVRDTTLCHEPDLVLDCFRRALLAAGWRPPRVA